jgi:hypothetical protein
MSILAPAWNGSVIGLDVATDAPVYLPFSERASGLYCLGKTGFGKSTLFINLIIQDIEAGFGICVIDPHGDLIDDVLERVPKSRERDVIVVELTDREFAFGLNLFECADSNDEVAIADTAEQVVQVFKKVWGTGETASWGSRLEDLLRSIAHTMLANPGRTLLDVPRLLYDDAFRAQLVARVKNQAVVEFWQKEYDPLHDKEQREMRSSTLNKVRAFNSNPLLKHIVGQESSTIDFRTVMEQNQVLLVKLSARHEDSTKLLGTTIVGRLLHAALLRAEISRAERTYFGIYADEYDWFATPDFAALLTQVRKYNIATTIAHQFRDQLDYKNKGATLQTANLIVFRVTGQDADELAGGFDHTPPAPEVIGQRERQSTTVKPLERLGSHSNPEVKALVQQYINPYTEVKEFRTVHSMVDYIDYLNSYFYAAMEAGTRWSLAEEAASVYPLITFSMFKFGMLPRKSTKIKRDLDEEYREQYQVFSQFNLEFLRAMRASPNVVELVMERFESTSVRRDSLFDAVQGLLGILEKERDPEPTYTMGRTLGFLRQWFVDWLTWCAGIAQLADLLKREPIMVGSGQYDPIFGPIRTYADMQNEIASILANLPRHHARCKLGEHEYTIKTLRPLPQSAPADISVIRRRSRDRYCHLRADIEEKIQGSQKVLSESGAILSPLAHENDILPQTAADDNEEDYLTEVRE